MNKTFRGLLLAVLLGGAVPAMMPALSAEPAAKPQPAKYSVSSTLVGTLLDDPAANEVLKKMIPTVYANEMFHTMGRESTLAAIQQYEPEALSNENLAKVQAELDKLPARGGSAPAQGTAKPAQ
jgi:hypothetical protein